MGIVGGLLGESKGTVQWGGGGLHWVSPKGGYSGGPTGWVQRKGTVGGDPSGESKGKVQGGVHLR